MYVIIVNNGKLKLFQFSCELCVYTYKGNIFFRFFLCVRDERYLIILVKTL